MQLEIVFGAVSETLDKQLYDANLTAHKDLIVRWQKDADAITRLAVRGLLADSQTKSARQKLMKAICKNVKPIEAS